MGSIQSLQRSMGYLAPMKDPEKQCQRCTHLTAAADSRSVRLPYCQKGGFFVWRDAGCNEIAKPAIRRAFP